MTKILCWFVVVLFIANADAAPSLDTKVKDIEGKLAGIDTVFSETHDILAEYVGQGHSDSDVTTERPDGFVEQAFTVDERDVDVTVDGASGNSAPLLLLGYRFEFQSFPTSINPLTTRNVTLRCVVTDSITSGSKTSGSKTNHTTQAPLKLAYPAANGRVHSDSGRGQTAEMSDVTSIVIKKDGEDVAAVMADGVKTFGESPGIHVTGQLSGISGKGGYLEVVFQYPPTQLAGSYVCDVTGIDQHGHGHSLVKTVKVAEQKVNIAYLVDKIHKMEVRQRQAIDVFNSTMARQNKIIGDLNTTVEEQRKTIDDMNRTMDTHINSLDNTNTLVDMLINVTKQQNETIHKQKETISELQTSMYLNNQVTETLLQAVQDQNKSIADQRESIQKLEKSMIDNTKVSKVVGDLVGLTSMLNYTAIAHQDKIDRLDATVGENKKLMKLLYQALEKQSNTLAGVVFKQNTTVYFSAGITGSDRSLSDGATLIYNKVFTNVGESYNSKTGEFTCKVSGYYMFHVHVRNVGGKRALAYLYHNRTAMVYAFGDDKNHVKSGSNTVVLKVNKGDVVKVKAGDPSQFRGHAYTPNTFTGVLLSMT